MGRLGAPLATVMSMMMARRTMSSITERCQKVDTDFRQKYIQVTVLGGDTLTGEMTAFLLKQNPVVSQLYLYGNDCASVAADLNHMDTKCRARGYKGTKGLLRALRRADVVLITGQDKCPVELDVVTAMRHEGDRVAEMALACTRYAPKAVVVVAAPPVAGNTAIVAEIFRHTHWYHPGRVVGSPALNQVKANNLVARYQDLDPSSVHVPLIGGPDIDCVVPLFSRATPVPLTPADCETLTECMRSPDGGAPESSKKQQPCKVGGYTMSEAHALNRLITSIGMGMCGDNQANATAYVRQSLIQNCRHLVTTVKFGPGGVVHNFGLPYLTRFELQQLEKATRIIAERECLAQEIRREFSSTTKFEVKTLVNPRLKRRKQHGFSHLT